MTHDSTTQRDDDAPLTPAEIAVVARVHARVRRVYAAHDLSPPAASLAAYHFTVGLLRAGRDAGRRRR
jgi:hypothetical protein